MIEIRESKSLESRKLEDSNSEVYIYDGTEEVPKDVTKVIVSNSVKSIRDCAFEDCTSLESITIGNSVKIIGYSAFYNCSSLRSITIPNSVTSIEDWAFAHCLSLKSITIPNSVTNIGGGAFAYCSSLNSITIPSSVTSIGSYAFEDCSSLESVTIPNSVTSIGSYAFEDCDNLTSVYYGGTIDKWVRISFDNYSSNPLSNGADLYINNKKVKFSNDMYESENYGSDDLFGVFSTGGSIGSNSGDNLIAWNGNKSGKLVKVFKSSDEARDYAKNARNRLSPGERSYYGMSYFTKKLSKKDKEHPQVTKLTDGSNN